MSSVQQLATKAATFAAVLAVGVLSSNAAQAAIVTGSVSGTWDYNYGQAANINVGDAYTATYSYDDAALVSFDEFRPGYFQYSWYSGSLLSLIVNSGSYSYTFDFSNGSGSVLFENFIGDPSYYDYKYKYVSLSGDNYFGATQNSFRAYKSTQQNYDGSLLNDAFAFLYSYDNQGNTTNSVGDNNAKFTPDPTSPAVPAPALLPGLIGLGVGVVRRRKVDATKQTSEV